MVTVKAITDKGTGFKIHRTISLPLSKPWKIGDEVVLVEGRWLPYEGEGNVTATITEILP